MTQNSETLAILKNAVKTIDRADLLAFSQTFYTAKLTEKGAELFLEELEKKDQTPDQRGNYSTDFLEFQLAFLMTKGLKYGYTYEEKARKFAEYFKARKQDEADEKAREFLNNTEKKRFIETAEKLAGGVISYDEAVLEFTGGNKYRTYNSVRTLDKIEKKKACKSYSVEKAKKLIEEDLERDYWRDVKITEDEWRQYKALEKSEYLKYDY